MARFEAFVEILLCSFDAAECFFFWYKHTRDILVFAFKIWCFSLPWQEDWLGCLSLPLSLCVSSLLVQNTVEKKMQCQFTLKLTAEHWVREMSQRIHVSYSSYGRIGTYLFIYIHFFHSRLILQQWNEMSSSTANWATPPCPDTCFQTAEILTDSCSLRLNVKATPVSYQTFLFIIISKAHSVFLLLRALAGSLFM